ncbi:MAG: phosphopantothenoylcysteine decarboxylase, partial [Alphaproteobacteria bacterium]
NPDVLALVAAAGQRRPRLVIGFAAETEADATRLAALANEKRARKNCDWVLANDVSPGTATFGGADNRIVLVDGTVTEDWPTMSKTAVADRLARRIALALTGSATGHASAEAALRAVS